MGRLQPRPNALRSGLNKRLLAHDDAGARAVAGVHIRVVVVDPIDVLRRRGGLAEGATGQPKHCSEYSRFVGFFGQASRSGREKSFLFYFRPFLKKRAQVFIGEGEKIG